MNLILSLVALALGPVLYGACRKLETLRSSLDGFLFVTIAGIVVVHIVPDVFNIAGFVALGFLVLGIAFAFSVERRPTVSDGQRYSWILMVGALGLVLHAAMDGIALLPGDHLHDAHAGGLHDGHDHGHGHEHEHEDEHGHGLDGLLSNHLALGVILHRIPVGMAIWWTLRPALGSGIAITALGLIAAATSAAYLLGEPIIALMHTNSVACFQAFVAGTLLHVIVFSTVRRNERLSETPLTYTAVGERLGVIAGLFLLFLVPHAH